MEDMCWREWNGNWEGRDATRWTGSIKNLRKKIPTFTQEVFCIGTEVNKYKDLIVREPLREVRGDFGYDEAITRGRIPIAAMSNNYRGHTYRGRMQGYKLVNHHDLLEDVLRALTNSDTASSQSDIESLEATLQLSIYGARMGLEFLVPHYKRDSYILKVICRNSVDGKFALTINLFLHDEKKGKDIPFDGFHHTHTQELEDESVNKFLFYALHKFSSAVWNAKVDRGRIEPVIPPEVEPLIPPGPIDIIQFLNILAALKDKGNDVFSGTNLVTFAKLTSELYKLVYKTQEQETETSQTVLFDPSLEAISSNASNKSKRDLNA